ncbi:quinone oxidoreductase family protein [Caldimonas thermodepolymerans]|uniref:quinone oxidoreductase family protein n=1 Tax=Caldimonas thermodepolymerans TaxID=215580 RepID=UPI00223659C4|nr:quinone oxidoreductase [Caldimonas thermodepolymerans]UZG44403.1 quinone oxidoreductase [Caldimonas thermodepolymerans]
MNTMTQAQAIRIHAYGEPDEMRLEQVEVSSPAPGEVQIVQHAVGVNYLDTYHRRGLFPLPAMPATLGVEAAGVVTQVGDGVTRLRVGDRVAYACPPIGSYTTLRNLPARHVVRLPAEVSFEQAAAATLQGLTAHMLLHKVARVGPGTSILVHAAAGGLGSLLTQWAKRLGARVIGIVGSDEKAEIARLQGCDDVIVGRGPVFVEETLRLTGRQGVDVVFEGIGGEIFHQSLRVARPFGQVVNLGQAGEGLPSVNLADLGPARSLSVSVPGVFAYVRTHTDLQGVADELFGLIRGGELKVRIGGRFPLRDAAEAHKALQSRGTTGSLVLLPEVQA